ncbi:MAG TPA: hypothetical protein VF503_22530 [Sphingobium sp.]|uniref:hypothetical protein n=1 Tax=Sphingobium sp. TaxID=1912891 RepID=UPI002ED4A00B
MTNVRMGEMAANQTTPPLPSSPHRSWDLADEQSAQNLSPEDTAKLLQRLWAVIDGKED